MVTPVLQSHGKGSVLNGQTVVINGLQAAAGGAVYVWVYCNTSVGSVTDSMGSTYKLLQKAGGPNLSLYAADNVKGSGSFSLTVVANSATSFIVVNAVSLSSVTNPSLDSVGAGSTGHSTTASDAVVAAAGGELLLLGAVTTPNAGIVPQGGLTTIDTNAPTGATLNDSDVASAGPGSTTLSATVTPSSEWTAIAVAVKGPAVGPPLSVVATGTPTTGNSPLAVAFMSAASGGTSPYTYAWTFGDGGTSTAQNPTHTYAAPGTYTATVTATDAAASTAHASVVIKVYAPGPGGSSSSGAMVIVGIFHTPRVIEGKYVDAATGGSSGT